ncbi:hypothetical protein SteCoe_21277 [Stentor coeruleus]|uniref:sn-1-specific diacylglycerol lipase n=1 Tax=Stentor coeruleus TaxID=5963 RepID=A0A1R2BPU4_9CILI|nr:hypothetical protein SteCoe_21277 [Stentor coeruleus]
MFFYYKIVSGSAVITERLQEKYFEIFGQMLIHIIRPIVCGLYTISNPILPVQYKIRDCHRKIISIIGHNYKRNRRFARNITKNLNVYQTVLEEELKKNGNQVDDWIFSLKNRKVLDDIFYFIENNLQEIIDMPFSEILKSFLRYVKEQKKILCKLWDQKVEYPEELVKKFPDLLEYAGYSKAIYGSSKKKELWRDDKKKIGQKEKNMREFIEFTKVAKENIIYNLGASSMYLPVNAVVLSHEKKSILIVIRGTKSLFDCATDIDSQYTEITICGITGKVHSGILKSSESVSKNIRDKVLEYLSTNPGYGIIITGHSLGAGCGSLLTLLWLNDTEMNKYPIKCFAYAPPSVLSTNLNYLLKGIVLSCVNGDDMIPRLSYGSLVDFNNMILYIYKQDLNQEFDDFYEKFRGECKMEKIYPPGDVMQIFHKSEAQYSNFCIGKGFNENSKIVFVPGFVSNDFYGTILFSKTMLKNHKMDRYIEGLNDIMQKLWNGHGFS